MASTILGASEGFGGSQLRRLFLPGLFAAVGLHAYFPTQFLMGMGRPLGLNQSLVFTIEVILYGYLLSSGAKPIFYLYEGFLIPGLTSLAGACNRRKVQRLQLELGRLYEEEKENSQEAAAILAFLSDFPIKSEGNEYVFEVERPTRLGNLIASYELYPERAYGIDVVFFWHHIRFLGSKDSRADVDEKTLVAESLVLSSAAGAVVALVALGALAGLLLGRCLPAALLLPSPVTSRTASGLGLLGIAVFLVCYRLSWPAYRELRDAFRAMVDLAVPAFQEWIKKAPSSKPPDLEEQAARVQRYLQTLHPQ